MKNFLMLIAINLITSAVMAQYANGGEYMAAISNQYKSIQTDMWDYTNAAAHGKNASTVEKKRAELIQTTYEAKGNVMKMKDFQGNSAYRDSVVSFLKIYYIVLNEDYGKIVNMEEIAEKSYDNMEAYMMAKEEANEKLSAASDMLSAEQRKFAEEFNIDLREADDDLSTKMKVADEVYTYYNEIYLIFFKSYVSDFYLSDAITRADVNAIEQNKNALSSASAEGLEKMKSIKPFNGDNSVVQAVTELLKFYQREADELIEHITNYFIKAENFATIKKSFDQKKEKERTKEDVDQYNGAVNESNAAAQKYNETNADISTSKTKVTENWNKTVEKFIDTQIPKGKAK